MAGSGSWRTYALIGAAMLGVAGFMYARNHGLLNNIGLASSGVSSDASSSLRSSTTHEPASKTLSILFIGNSYTFVNDLPGMLLQAASSDPSNQIRLEVDSLVRGGAHFHDYVNDGSAARMIASRHWDFVVMQEQSEWAVDMAQVRDTFAAGEALAKEIKAAGAVPVFYVTWARKPGSASYPVEGGIILKNAAWMQQSLDYYSASLAKKIGAAPIMAGDYWAIAEGMDRGLNLYMPDNSHPNPAGTYLTALLFFRFFTGHAPAAVTFAPQSLIPEHAAELRVVAAK